MGEFKITAVCTVTDPRERQRRWNQAFRLLLELPSEEAIKEQGDSYKTTEQADGRVAAPSEE
jgi:hypothetical protein